MYNGEHGDVHDYGECERDRNGELHGAGGYVDHSDSSDASDPRDVATVYGDGDGDGGIFQWSDVDGSAAGGKLVECWDDYRGWALSDAVSSAANSDRDGDKHL
jgi:hypothetical protein